MNGVNTNLQNAVNEFLTNKRLAEQRYEGLSKEVEELERRVSKVARASQPNHEVNAAVPVNAVRLTVESVPLADTQSNALTYFGEELAKIIPLTKEFLKAHFDYKEINPGLFYSPRLVDLKLEKRVKPQLLEIEKATREAYSRILPDDKFYNQIREVLFRIMGCLDMVRSVEDNVAILQSFEIDLKTPGIVVAYRVVKGIQGEYHLPDALLSNLVTTALTPIFLYRYAFLLETFWELLDRDQHFFFAVDYQYPISFFNRSTLNLLKINQYKRVLPPKNCGGYFSTKSLMRYDFQHAVHLPKCLYALTLESKFIRALTRDRDAARAQLNREYPFQLINESDQPIQKLITLIKQIFFTKSEISIYSSIPIAQVFVMAALTVHNRNQFKLFAEIINGHVLFCLNQEDLLKLGLKIPLRLDEVYFKLFSLQVELNHKDKLTTIDSALNILNTRFPNQVINPINNMIPSIQQGNVDIKL